jgi:predicted MFS family arabinose efflux permease
VTPGIFSLMTSQLRPVGLLTPVAATLQISARSAGLTVTVPGLVEAISAPSTIAVAGGRDRRLALCVLIAPMGLANLASAIAPSFAVPATVLIVGGVSAASALGVPLGTMTGEIDGRRSAFAALGGFAISRPPRPDARHRCRRPPRVRTLLT